MSLQNGRHIRPSKLAGWPAKIEQSTPFYTPCMSSGICCWRAGRTWLGCLQCQHRSGVLLLGSDLSVDNGSLDKPAILSVSFCTSAVRRSGPVCPLTHPSRRARELRLESARLSWHRRLCACSEVSNFRANSTASLMLCGMSFISCICTVGETKP